MRMFHRVVIFLYCTIQLSGFARSGNVCQYTEYYQERRTSSCGFLWLRRCSSYTQHSRILYRCCSGWDGYYCDYALCDGKRNPYACKAQFPNGSVDQNGGGRCSQPGICVDCNTGYYPDGPYCRACTKINHCDVLRCTRAGNSVCARCEGEYGAEYGTYAFTKFRDGGITCGQVCSWREGSRCYPGNCLDYTNATCKCVDGFSGPDCAQITQNSSITFKFVRLIYNKEVMEAPPDRQRNEGHPPSWTNLKPKTALEVNMAFQGIYDPDITKYKPPIYIMKSEVGIIYGKLQLDLYRGERNISMTYKYECDTGVNTTILKNFHCEKNFTLQAWPAFLHLDRIKCTFEVKNGGRVSFQNYDNNKNVEQYTLQGLSTQQSFDIYFDYKEPVHCSEELLKHCNIESLHVPDRTNTSSFRIAWNGWQDTDSGISKYEIDVFQLQPNGIHSDATKLVHGGRIQGIHEPLNASVSETKMSIKVAGAYAVVLTVCDKAGNKKSTRRILIFDNNSVVEKMNNPPRVTTASPDTNYTWITKTSKVINIVWDGHFANKKYENLLWLNAVEKIDMVDNLLDDHEGERQTNRTDNVRGIVRFEVGYETIYEGNVTHHPFQRILNVHSESTDLIEDLMDGKRLAIHVKAYDIMDHFDEDIVIVTVDTSPPNIENLWLTRGDRVKISVHNMREFANITVEWLAFDIHSGVNSVGWRLYDNQTGVEIEHGHGCVPPQGNAKDLDECKNKYMNYSRGSDCYSTPFHGSYHRHFTVRPQLSAGGIQGLRSDKDKGVHEGDYFFEVEVENLARLKTKMTMKLTIDISPPHEGSVHEGFPGQPELDFQQSTVVHAYWDGFFDKESGVLFYRYGFSNKCLSAEHFTLGYRNYSLIKETNSTTALYNASSEGTYFLTVVAYNHALEPSKPVCSDGISIETSLPKVGEIRVEHVRIRGGLVKDDNNSVWYLDENRVLYKVKDPTSSCRTKATSKTSEDLSLLAKARTQDDEYKQIPANFVCDSRNGAPERIIGIFSAPMHFRMSWISMGAKSRIFDYFVGISSTTSLLPDRFEFISTNQHAHIHVPFPNIDEGEEFYILIKTISKSSMESIQAIGPFIVDSTRPKFRGEIDVTVENGYVKATWTDGAFWDDEDSTPLIYQIAIGHAVYETDVLPFNDIWSGEPCPPANKTITCASVSIAKLKWQLHDHHTYYVTIKAENTGGLFVTVAANPYIYDAQLPTKGVVYETYSANNKELQDIEDIDFQTNTTSISAVWYGFGHPHLQVGFIICIGNTTLVLKCEDVGNATRHTITSVQLNYFTMYFITIIASSTSGNTSVTSDGVIVVKEGVHLPGVHVMDGRPCINKLCKDSSVHVQFYRSIRSKTRKSIFRTKTSVSKPAIFERSEVENNLMTRKRGNDVDKAMLCEESIKYQSSLNTIEAHWFVPEKTRSFTPSMFWSVEERAQIGDLWSTFREYEHIHSSNEVREHGIDLQPGRKYRVALKFCAGQICFHPVYSNGVTVTPSPPVTGKLSVQYSAEENKIYVLMEQFYDPDIAERGEAMHVIDHYEWAFTENSHFGSTLTSWERIGILSSTNSSHVSFTINVSRNISFTKCWRLAIRGYTHAGLSSVVSNDIRSCGEQKAITGNIVLDIIGAPVPGKDGRGQGISLEQNETWPFSDADYTPFQNILSAVWPKLRSTKYTWAVLEDKSANPTTFYKSDVVLKLNDPCAHPDAIKCGDTDVKFVNIKFQDGDLEHGKRYIICIHTNTTVIKHQNWDEQLPEVSACSDGVTIDLTPPKPGTVWLGVEMGTRYQGSKSDISVNWELFEDIEELGRSVHASGIKEYYLALGSSPGAIDVMPFINVGVTNHETIHNLTLQNGHSYYASIKALDFANRATVSTSAGITVDYTAPDKTNRVISINSRHLTSVNYVTACWKGVFEDKESGILKYEWSVGSQPSYCDIMPYTTVYEECSETSSKSKISLHEGHAYFVSVKAYNGLGLSSSATSWAFTVDTSPPSPGHVYDGKSTPGKAVKDVDFTIDKSSFDAHWEGFHDPHTAIQEYYISTGTCKGCEDVLNYQPVGIVYEFHVHHLHLVEGITYYTTVTACNTANLCTSVTSDGIQIDTSPPVRGRVHDGIDVDDIHYQATNNSIASKWFGFSDPQSGISHYSWRGGTSRGTDDVFSATLLHQNELAVIPDLQSYNGRTLPVGRRIYITIRAYNKAGQYSESISNGFIVDLSPPLIVSPPRLVDIGVIYPNTTVSRTTLRLEWDVRDNESYIERQYLSIKSHIGGDFNLSSIQVGGIVRDYTFVDLDLHDGSQYCVMLIVCNGAKLCTSTMTPRFVADSSPPTTGMFAINTDHAVNLNRQPENWMKWSIFNVDLAWLGFSDLHSGIKHYKINIGSTYMGSNLNKNPLEPVTVAHNNTGEGKEGEGIVQTYRIPTSSLNNYTTIYISLWAVNGVGLRSPMIHSQFRLLDGFMMELVRRCSAYSCLGHCVCAPEEEKCNALGLVCNNNYTDSTKPDTRVIDIQNVKDPDKSPQIQCTATDSLLSARWTSNSKVSWYEWSVGFSTSDKPIGVFSESQETVWHHAGNEKHMIYSLPRSKRLANGMTYSFFVRAWFNEKTFAVFKSEGVYIDAKPPGTTNSKGKSVKETINNLTNEVDFAKWDDEIYVDWTGKFREAQTCGINMFRLYISTYPGGHDVHTTNSDLSPSVNRYRLSVQTMIPSTRYYSNIQAYSKSGLHTTVTSDGFMIDSDSPVPGVVYDGRAWKDMEFQNSSAEFGSSWHSFSDQDSGIRHYIWCTTTQAASQTCSVMPWKDIGIFTSGSYKLNQSVDNGLKILHKVYAVDDVGHMSSIVESDGVIVDSTAPVREDGRVFLANLIHNPSFEEDKFGKTCFEIARMTNCSKSAITGWSSTPGSCVWLATTGVQHAQDGKSFLVIRGSVKQAILGLEKNKKYRVLFYTSHLPFPSSVLANNEGFINIDENRNIFLLYNRVHRHDNINASQTFMIWHQHTFYFTAGSSNVTIEIGSTDRSAGIAIDNVQVQKNDIRRDLRVDQSNHVQVHTVHVEDWSSVHATWDFDDPESPIVDYTWAIGLTVGGTQLQDFRSVGLRNFAFNSSLKLMHNSSAHVTVVATNAAGLKTVSYSEPVMVDLTAPILGNINDGKGIDIDFQDTSVIVANWQVNDPESGIKECQWAIGSQSGKNDLMNFTTVHSANWMVSWESQLNASGNMTIYVTVRCENGAGLVTSRSSDGVHVAGSAPSADIIEITVLGTSKSVYYPLDNFHGDETAVHVRWSIFSDDFGIETCEVTLEGQGTKVTEFVIADTQDYMCADFRDLHLKDGLYNIAVTGISRNKMRTETKVSSFTLLTKPPAIQDGRTIIFNWNSSAASLAVNWDFMFSSDYSLYYEVSAGTVQGGPDIIQWQETRKTNLLLSFDKQTIGPAGKDVFVTVRAICPSGLYETANAQILLAL